MRYLKYAVLLGLCMVVAGTAHAQVRVGVGVGFGPAYVGPAPVCAYGYYGYAPYACVRMETIEHSAKITLAAEMSGEPVLLSSREVAKLMAARSRYYVSSPPGGGGGLPITSDSGEVAEGRVTLTRNELDVLIEEAVRKDRARK